MLYGIIISRRLVLGVRTETYIDGDVSICHMICVWSSEKDLVSLAEDGAQDRDYVGLVGEVGEAENALELLKAHHRRRSGHEPHYRCVR